MSQPPQPDPPPEAPPSPPALEYRAADQVIANYHASQALLKYLRGPRGSTKTGAALMELWAAATTIIPCKDNTRHTRFMLSRESYPSLQRSTLASAVKWFGGYGHVKNSQPPRIEFDFPLPDGTKVKSEWIFQALPDDAAVQGLRSQEFTAAFLNECIELPLTSLAGVAGSLNRWPSLDMIPDEVKEKFPPGAPLYRSFTLIDTNPGDEADPWREKFEDAPPHGAFMGIQPGAFIELSPEAWTRYKLTHHPGKRDSEIPHKAKFGYTYIPNPEASYVRVVQGGYRYWANLIDTASSRGEVLKLVCNRWATAHTDASVFQSYNDEEHSTTDDIPINRASPVVIGLDHSGLHPAAVFTQVVGGCMVVLDECVYTDEKRGMTFEEFVGTQLVPMIQSRYAGCALDIVLDPSISRNQITGATVHHTLMQYGLAGRSAPTNDPRLRREAVARFLNRKRGFKVGPNVPRVRAAMRGGYRYKMSAAGLPTGDTVKDNHSHPADALQYAALGYGFEATLGSGLSAGGTAAAWGSKLSAGSTPQSGVGAVVVR